MTGWLILGGIILFFGFLIARAVANLIEVCSPNEVLIFAGNTSGYKVVKGGRGLRIPLFETVHRMDLTLITIDVSVTGAYSKGGIPLNVAGVANIKVSGERPELDRAVERFLGLSRENLVAVAKDTLEGALRGIVATMTPEDLNENKAAFERSLETEARDSLRKIGLTLDVLKIQSVEDRVGYLTAIGEKDKAELFRRARIAEAENRGQSQIKDAENKQMAQVAKLQAQIETLKAEANRRITNAKTEGAAMVAEEEGKVQAAVARAEASLEVQKARIEQVKLQLEADVIQPAKAAMEASIREARGNASRISEEGRAIADGLKALVERWRASGDSAREMLLLQKLDDILKVLMSGMEGIHIDRVSVFAGAQKGEGGNGSSEGNGHFTSGLLKVLEEVKSGTGFDVAGSLSKLTGSESEPKALSSRAASRLAAKIPAREEDSDPELEVEEDSAPRARIIKPRLIATPRQS